jgi:hypothetical protein
METRHLNNIKTDNRLSNLRWGARHENDRDKSLSGSVKGTRNPAAKLTEDDVRAIRTMTAQEASKRFNINPGTAQRIIKRERWSHVQ